MRVKARRGYKVAIVALAEDSWDRMAFVCEWEGVCRGRICEEDGVEV